MQFSIIDLCFIQQSAKQLLGIPRDTSICMRVADPPHETVGSLSTLLHQPSHLVNLVVQPIHSRIMSSSGSQDAAANLSGAATITSRERKDPYCVFREKYCKGLAKCKRSGSIRDKCDFVEMNRLISRLSEVSICLKRTQQECELIEKRCARKLGGGEGEKAGNGHSDSTSDGGVKFRKIEHSISSSSSNSDSGKGSMTGAEALEGVIEEEEAEGVDSEPTEGLTAADREVERLLRIAQALTQQQHRRKGEGVYILHVPNNYYVLRKNPPYTVYKNYFKEPLFRTLKSKDSNSWSQGVHM